MYDAGKLDIAIDNTFLDMALFEKELTAAYEEMDAIRIGTRFIDRDLKIVTEQRDRLAEALRKFVILTERMSIGIEVGNDLIVAWDIADEALQSLTTNELWYNHSMNMNEQVKDIILSYCQGINHLEFDLTDLDEMVEKIIDNVTGQCGWVELK